MDLHISPSSDIRTPSTNINDMMQDMVQQTEQLSLALTHYSELFNERPLQRFQESLTGFVQAVGKIQDAGGVSERLAHEALQAKQRECDDQQHTITELEEQLELLLRQYQQLAADHQRLTAHVGLIEDAQGTYNEDEYA